MVDNLSKDSRRKAMRAVKATNTKPEMRLRKALYARGFRYRLHARDLPGKPDIVFRSRRKAVFVHGCFWHGHDCKRGARLPKTNRRYWETKIEQNRIRDAAQLHALSDGGWGVFTAWECEFRKFDCLLTDLESFLDETNETDIL